MIRAAIALSSLLAASIAVAAPARPKEAIAGGAHWRFETERGPVHLFRPAGYDRRTAGLVIYVHGLYTHVDEAWREHRLAEQFAASGQNALFIVPEAPAAGNDAIAWPELPALVETALALSRLKLPPGPRVAVGHSGAYRTLVGWLADPTLSHLILVDALYGNEDDFRAWLDADPAHRMTLVVKGTAKWADPFVAAIPDAVTVATIPAALDELPRAARRARLLCLRSQYGHMELITEGKTLPILLRRTALRALPPLPPTKN